MSAVATPTSTRDTTIAAVPDVYIPRPTAAELLSVCDRRIVILARQGRISTRQIPGARVRYSLRDVLSLLAAS
jgi:hypothetical protein